MRTDEYGVRIDATKFPDDNFRDYVWSLYLSGYITNEELQEPVTLNCSGKNIRSLQGIEFFTGLVSLSCQGNKLTSIDLSANTNLKMLNCSNNQLTELDLSENKLLEELTCSRNKLESLSLTDMDYLRYLDCCQNPLLATAEVIDSWRLAYLDLSYCQALQTLDCNNNDLETLDVTGCTGLKRIDCSYNALEEIDVSSCRETLQYLSFMYNGITSFDARNFPLLETLITAMNPLTSLNVSGCDKLSMLVVFWDLIDQQNMGNLVNSLPVCTAPSGGYFIASPEISFSATGDFVEDNVITDAQIATAASKKWIPLKIEYIDEEPVFAPINGSSKLGDVNFDGNIDVADVVDMISIVLTGRASDEISRELLSGVADMNQDSMFDVSDVVDLVYYVLNGHLPGEETTETFTVGGVSFNMVKVEGGTFTMGATPEQAPYANSNEYPAHEVTLSSYSIGETEVTQALWKAVMGTNPSNYTGDLTCPVEMVSWDECQTFITKLNQMTGKQFRLPTEAEWEYAARGGNKSQGYIYSGSNNRDEVAWATNDFYGHAHPVGTKQPNELGLYDMSGNVFEWVQDYYGQYSSAPQTNPTGPATGSLSVTRGGSFSHNVSSSRVSCRYSDDTTSRWNDQGLRLAL